MGRMGHWPPRHKWVMEETFHQGTEQGVLAEKMFPLWTAFFTGSVEISRS